MTFASVLAAVLLLGAQQPFATRIAAAVDREANSREEAAFLLAWAEHESHFEERIARNECKRWECDRGRARGLWQLHRGAAGRVWDDLPGNVDAQARAAARMTRWAFRECHRDVRCAFRVLGGLPQGKSLRGEEGRLASYARALEKL